MLAKGLDSGTAFEILSIDIADVDVGKNIGAELQTGAFSEASYVVLSALKSGLQDRGLAIANSIGAVATPSLLAYNYAIGGMRQGAGIAVAMTMALLTARSPRNGTMRTSQ